MNDKEIKEIVDEILKIEKESINRRRDTINAATTKFGRNKADSDVVNRILAIMELGGQDNEN